ncbi:polyprenyl synthetase family protein [Azohydromonas lata]|uniref:Polyprenyl synthetase family protein n=1 Tax=Azohydromonas lata TaxID=45677 RepID=A0ABU5IJ48_9BURK|nr:polyprenyl synthetase family protein [Azohydromonas lata]MDZ5458613.1 polyprenyl synthetase family protein [Azohydromonas lata]
MTLSAADPMVFLPAVDDPVLSGLRSGFEAHLAAALPKPRDAADLVVAAMREAALSPGKRIRPLLLLAATHALGRPASSVMDAACALELVHAASLVMDDLPCMDDASLRRGRPTLHRQFGEDVASLAVIGLLSQAFRLAAASPALEPGPRARLTVLLADAVGCQGLVGGQLRDLRCTEGARTARDAAVVNRCKTGALFRAALQGAAIAAGAQADVQDALGRCADDIGQAFQLLDDLKDDGALAPTGKDTHQDEGKTTLLSLLGRDTARRRLQRHLLRVEDALTALFPQEDVVLRLLRRGCGFDALGQAGARRSGAAPPQGSAAAAG